MPVITDIVRNKKNKIFFSIFVDNEYMFSLSEPDLEFLNLKINQKISQEKLDFFIDTYVSQKAFDYTYRILSKQQLSENLLKEKLQKKQFPEEIINKVIMHLKEIDYINDEKFILEYAFQKVEYKLIGPFKLYYELLNKKFKPVLIKNTIEKVFNKLDEYDIAEQAFQKKFSSMKIEKSDLKILKKIENHLNSRGFHRDIIHDIIRKIIKETV